MLVLKPSLYAQNGLVFPLSETTENKTDIDVHWQPSQRY